MMIDGMERLAAALSDRYRLERELGRGGMATVYLAQDLKHDRKVAIKVLKPELAAVLGAERFVQEIKTTAALSHPHILPLFDSGEAGGFLYYVMPYIEGETIREKLTRETQFAHRRSGTDHHRGRRRARLRPSPRRDPPRHQAGEHPAARWPADGDGLRHRARRVRRGWRTHDRDRALSGHAALHVPEQATADKEITARSDIYSLASVLYEMLAGQPPHTGGSAQQIIMKIIAEPAAPVTSLRKSVPPNVAAALAKALEKLPADRFDAREGVRRRARESGVCRGDLNRNNGGPGLQAPLVA